MLNKLAKKFITALILAIVVLSLSGCRESMVIQEIIYDQASEDIDFQNDLKIAKSDENSQNEDENMPTKKNKENKEKNKEEHQASKKGDKDNNGSASNTTYNQNSKPMIKTILMELKQEITERAVLQVMITLLRDRQITQTTDRFMMVMAI